ncbi:hypothetical protein [Pseudomonas aeruginosa]|uniref:hypothetical protein n=1 Tax=Pseudomonas aeruginosa TaxID=287 RepID=UPI0015C4F068|nr:hypothetical protein [Pseudomonas aeruginosa]
MSAMDELDFSGLSDDQLVELAIAIANEAARRNPALQVAFSEALATEKEKIEARLRGAERARRYEIQQAERVAEAAGKAVADEKMRSKRTELLRRYLEQVAGLIGKAPQELTLVWKSSDWTRAPGPRLQVNLGSTGTDVKWHLIDYAETTDQIWTSPALAKLIPSLLPWAREVCVAVRAINIDRTTVARGAEVCPTN